MADDVKVPGFKKPLPKWGVAAGLGGVGVAIFLYYRSHNSSSSSSSAPAAAGQYPPDGTVGNPSDPYSTDPATGQTYGDEATGATGAYGAYGSGSSSSDAFPWDGTYGNPNDPYSMDPSTGQTYGDEGLAGDGGTGGGGGDGGGSSGPPFSTNTAWSNWVVQQLQTDNPSINTGDLLAALGLYLAGQPVSSAQKTLVLDAEGIGGPPPVAGTNNYPPNIRTDGGKGGGGGTGEAVQNIHVIGRGRDYLTVGWTAQTGVRDYEVRAYDPKGAQVADDKSSGTSQKVTGLQAGTRYHVYVRADNGPPGSGAYFDTFQKGQS